MYSTSELDELFQILNSIKGFKLDNHKGTTQQYESLCRRYGKKWEFYSIPMDKKRKFCKRKKEKDYTSGIFINIIIIVMKLIRPNQKISLCFW